MTDKIHDGEIINFNDYLKSKKKKLKDEVPPKEITLDDVIKNADKIMKIGSKARKFYDEVLFPKGR